MLDPRLAFIVRPFARRYESLRRDVAMVRATFEGRSPPAVVPLARRPRRAHGALLGARSLRVARVVRETRDAVTLVLEDPSGAPIPFVAGQFFTLLAPLGTEPQRRAYSASSAPGDARSVSITAKRVVGGRVSSWLNDEAREGMLLDVLGPSGSFTWEPSSGARRIVLVAGGSGITPLMSIARCALAAGDVDVALLYGNRRETDIVFRAALDALVVGARGRLRVRHVLSEPGPGWGGGVGLLDRDVTARELGVLAADTGADHYVCGPEPMRVEVRAALAARGVPDARVREERFTSPESRVAAAGAAGTITLRRAGRERAIRVEAHATLLEAALAAGEAMPYSCAMGGCGACKVRLHAGAVEMDEPSCLTPQERRAGYVLACVARPSGDATVEVEPC